MRTKKARNTTGRGYFQVTGDEPLAKKGMTVRLPESLDAQVRQIAGSDLSGWLRRAIAAQLSQEESPEALDESKSTNVEKCKA